MNASATALPAITDRASPAARPVSVRASPRSTETRSAWSSRASSSTARFRSAVRSQVKSRTRSRARSPSERRSSPSSTIWRVFSTSSSGVRARRPVSPSTIDSGSPPTAMATLGVPHAAASITVRHQPSAEEAVMFTHARWNSSSFFSSLTWPCMSTREPSPRSAISCSSASRWSPSPAISSVASGICSSTSSSSSIRL